MYLYKNVYINPLAYRYFGVSIPKHTAVVDIRRAHNNAPIVDNHQLIKRKKIKILLLKSDLSPNFHPTLL